MLSQIYHCNLPVINKHMITSSNMYIPLMPLYVHAVKSGMTSPPNFTLSLLLILRGPMLPFWSLNSPSFIKINCVIYAPTAICSYFYYGPYFILLSTRVSCLCPWLKCKFLSGNDLPHSSLALYTKQLLNELMCSVNSRWIKQMKRNIWYM